MKNCLGVSLGSHDGICIVKVTLEETIHDFKLLIRAGADGKSITISGVVPDEVMDHYYKFEEIFILNERTEKKFSVKKLANTPYGLIEEASFNLYPNIALGNLLKVYIQAFGDRFALGDCSIVLKDASFDEKQFVIDHYSSQQHEKAKLLRQKIFFFLVICVIIIILTIIAGVLIKRYRKVKQETFEGAMSARKERYADTARMISTARGIASARGSAGLPIAATVRDSTSARSNFALRSQSPENKAERREYQRSRSGHIELQEVDDEDQ